MRRIVVKRPVKGVRERWQERVSERHDEVTILEPLPAKNEN